MIFRASSRNSWIGHLRRNYRSARYASGRSSVSQLKQRVWTIALIRSPRPAAEHNETPQSGSYQDRERKPK